MTARRVRGFTLLELLVALAVFAVLAVLSWQGLQVVLNAGDRVDRQAERLGRLQMLMVMMERDIEQAVARPVRDNYGETLPALRGDENGFEFTHTGWRNPAGLPRSELQRVAWTLEDETLTRRAWQALDRAQDSEPYRNALLDRVASFQVRYLNHDRGWLPQWPPAVSQPVAAPLLPLAVEVTLELADWGEITRLFRVVGPLPPAGGAAAQGAT